MEKIINKYYTFIKYMFSSGICLVFDLLLFTIFNFSLRGILGIFSITVAIIIARIISSCLNYYLNSNKVFNMDDKFNTATFIQYVMLVIIQMIVSSVAITFIYKKTYFNETLIKLFVDIVLFFINFVVQKYLIFNKKRSNKNKYLLLLFAILSTLAIVVKPIITTLELLIDIRGKIIIMAIICIALYNYYKKYYNSLNFYKPFSVLSIIFTLLLIFGYSFDVSDSSYLVYGNIQYLALSIIKFIGYYIFINFILNFICYKLEEIEIKPYISKRFKVIQDAFAKQPFKTSFIILFIVYLVYFIAFYPGIFGYDPSYQIQEYMHIPTFYTIGTDVVGITQFNPVIHTLLIGSLFKIGHLIGYDNLGLAIYTLIQMIAFIATLSYTLKVMNEEKVNSRLIFICLLIYLFMPFFPFYSLSAFKDTYYAMFFILFIVHLFKTIKYKMTSKDLFLLSLISIGVCAFRHNGYITVLISLLLLLLLKLNRKYVLLSILIVSIVHIGYGQVLNYYKVTPTSIREVLSIPIQQTSALIVNKEYVIDDNDKQIINKIIDYRAVKENYNPELSDPIKNTFKNDSSKEDLMAYFNVWFKYLIKEPRIYIDATINNVYGYLYPEAQNWYFYYKKYSVLNASGFDYHYIKFLEPLRTVLTSYGMAYQYIPILSLTTSIGLTAWVYLYLMLLLFRNKKNKYVLMLIPAFLTILMCLVGPVNSYYRYVIPYSMSLPFILCIMYNEIKNKIK